LRPWGYPESAWVAGHVRHSEFRHRCRGSKLVALFKIVPVVLLGLALAVRIVHGMLWLREYL
jgi:hypothetical protein